MKKALPLVSVRDRLVAAIRLHKFENPGRQLTVSELARMADANRPNLYKHHRDLLDEATARPSRGKARRPPTKNPEISGELRLVKQQNRALVYLVGELRAEILRLRARLASPAKGRR